MYQSKPLGSIGDVGCFSFHAVKNLATGEGGMITTNRREWDKQFRKIRWMGITKDTWNRTGPAGKYDWYYEVDALGFKYHMSDVQGALGLVQLKKLDRMNRRRGEIAHRYSKAFAGLSWLTVPVEKKYAKRSWHNYVVQVENGRRDELMAYLKERNISSSVHYYPNHLYDLYKPFRVSLPMAEEAWKKILTLPLFPDLTNKQVDRIIEVVRGFDREIRSA
jgi:perosamine synthetase